ncbi:hypothetical protein K438DRAFT_1822993 [Mycena galopus ATCC 62051]|nr:hypothetical protein K438DRAFT_1822993 [Mycena galopus ATCC 62051]
MESPRVNTNHIPSDEEIKSIRQDIVSRSEELARIDERIRELSAQRDEIQAYLDAQKALISHPRRLPADIVREIFVACLPTSRNAVMSTHEAPLLLCRICSAWRTIALSTPRLWASLHLSLDFVLAREARISAATQWLQRSGACLTSISVYGHKQWGWGEPEDVLLSRAVLIRSLSASSARWRHAAFHNMSHETGEEFTEISSPVLESFEFSGTAPLFAQLKVLKVPTLRTVTLHFLDQGPVHGDEPLDRFVLGMPLVWDQLRHLELAVDRGIYLSNVIVLLGRCPQLVSVHIGDTNDTGVDATATDLSLPFLESFSIPSYLAPSSLSNLVAHVSMPRLRRFHVSAASCREEPQQSFFVGTLGKTSPLIEDFTIYLPSLTAQSLPGTLRSLSSLTRLVVFDVDSHSDWGLGHWENDLFDTCDTLQLFILLTDTTVCPALQELVVKRCNGSDKAILDAFIRRRLEFAHGFRRLELSFLYSAPTLMSDTEIDSYFSQGLDISIFWNRSWTPRSQTPPDPWTGLPGNF